MRERESCLHSDEGDDYDDDDDDDNDDGGGLDDIYK